ncbi:hypothetical protein C7120_05895 [Prevotella sp. oral taxon 376]|nr:hypothetical protein C7120_05895 [Prevotella sp. oral taxon 376]
MLFTITGWAQGKDEHYLSVEEWRQGEAHEAAIRLGQLSNLAVFIEGLSMAYSLFPLSDCPHNTVI